MRGPLYYPSIVLLTFVVSSCGFGYSIVEGHRTVLENLGSNRYVYRLTRLTLAVPRGAATVAIAVPPPGSHEVGLIEATVEYSGLGPGGLRGSESEFYPRLAAIAGQMGGTHFLVLRSTRHVDALDDWITSITADVLAE
jgi:hypothetical protein